MRWRRLEGQTAEEHHHEMTLSAGARLYHEPHRGDMLLTISPRLAKSQGHAARCAAYIVDFWYQRLKDVLGLAQPCRCGGIWVCGLIQPRRSGEHTHILNWRCADCGTAARILP